MTEVVCLLSYSEDGETFFDEIVTVKGVPKASLKTGFALVQDLIRAQKLNDRALMDQTVLALCGLGNPAHPHLYITANPSMVRCDRAGGSASKARKLFVQEARQAAKDLKALGAKFGREV